MNFQPSISIKVGPSIDTINPSENPMIIENNGILPDLVNYSISFDDILAIKYLDEAKDKWALIDFDVVQQKVHDPVLIKKGQSHILEIGNDIKKIIQSYDDMANQNLTNLESVQLSIHDKAQACCTFDTKAIYLPLFMKDSMTFILKRNTRGDHFWFQRGINIKSR